MNNSNDVLLKEVQQLEVELHKDAIRRNRDQLGKLLHPDFLEIGRSGTRYARDDVINQLSADAIAPLVDARDFELALVAEGIVLLTYSSAHVDTNGNRHRHALRSSLWVQTEKGWKIRFHQGTPTTAAVFEGK